MATGEMTGDCDRLGDTGGTLGEHCLINAGGSHSALRPEDGSAPVNPASAIGCEQLHQDIMEIRSLIEARLSDDRTKERAFERLYEELDALKKNKAFEDDRPFHMNLVLLYDRMGCAIKEHTGPASDVLRSLQEELREILSRRDIEVIQTKGDSFDPMFQSVVGTQTVDCQKFEGKVMRTVRDGFTHKGRVLRAQEVVIGRYRPPPANPEAVGRSGDRGREVS